MGEPNVRQAIGNETLGIGMEKLRQWWEKWKAEYIRIWEFKLEERVKNYSQESSVIYAN